MDPTDHLDFPGDVDVDAVILEFKGDMREAIRGLLHDLAVLAADYKADVSRGYVRGTCRGPCGSCGGPDEDRGLVQ